MKTLRIILFIAAVSLAACTAAHAQVKPVNTKADFDAARARMDSLDAQMLKTIGERERVVREIGIYKAKNHIAPLQPARFQQVVEKAKEAGGKEGLSPQFIEKLMNAIHEESLKLEEPAAVHNE